MIFYNVSQDNMELSLFIVCKFMHLTLVYNEGHMDDILVGNLNGIFGMIILTTLTKMPRYPRRNKRRSRCIILPHLCRVGDVPDRFAI